MLYVTHSAYLARNARELYYTSVFEREDQDATSLSYREFVESIRMPQAREVGWREFSGWSARLRQGQAIKYVDGHQAFRRDPRRHRRSPLGHLAKGNRRGCVALA